MEDSLSYFNLVISRLKLVKTSLFNLFVPGCERRLIKRSNSPSDLSRSKLRRESLSYRLWYNNMAAEELSGTYLGLHISSFPYINAPVISNTPFFGIPGGFHLVFTWFRFPGGLGMHLFSMLRYSMRWRGAERGFGGDLNHGSRPLLEDWVEVACSQKTWRLNNWRRRYDFNRLISCFLI